MRMKRGAAGETQSAQAFLAIHRAQRRQPVQARRTGDENTAFVLAHATQAFLRTCRGDEVVAGELIDGVAHQLVNRAGALAAVDVDARHTHMKRDDGAGQHLAAITEQQQESGFSRCSSSAHAAQAIGNAQRCLRRARAHVPDRWRADRQVPLARTSCAVRCRAPGLRMPVTATCTASPVSRRSAGAYFPSGLPPARVPVRQITRREGAAVLIAPWAGGSRSSR